MNKTCLHASTKGKTRADRGTTLQVLRPLLPKHKPADDQPDGPSALRRFSEAEKLMQEDPRFVRAPARDR